MFENGNTGQTIRDAVLFADVDDLVVRTPTEKAEGSAASRSSGVLAGYVLGSVIPPAPDFGIETHRPFRGKLSEIVNLVEARDVAALKAVENRRCSSSPQAMARHLDVAALAIEKRGNRLI